LGYKYCFSKVWHGILYTHRKNEKIRNSQNFLDMKRRNINYIQKSRAQKIMANVMSTDLMTFLSASMQLCKSAIVKTHVRETLQELGQTTSYRLSA
jgi:hypothetical protein